MKRFFLVADADLPGPGGDFGEWHAIDLGSHGTAGAGYHVLVLADQHITAPTAWQAFPHPLKAGATISSTVDVTKLTSVGLVGTMSTYDASEILKLIHPMMNL